MEREAEREDAERDIDGKSLSMKAFLFVFVFFCCGCVAMLLSVTDLHVCLELGCKLGFFFSVPLH